MGFHLMAGAVAGSIFTVQSLFLLLAVILLESAVLGLLYGGMAGLGGLAGLVAVQIGYLGGVYARSVLEQLAASADRPRPRRVP